MGHQIPSRSNVTESVNLKVNVDNMRVLVFDKKEVSSGSSLNWDHVHNYWEHWRRNWLGIHILVYDLITYTSILIDISVAVKLNIKNDSFIIEKMPI